MYREVGLGQRCDSGKKCQENFYLLSQLKKKSPTLVLLIRQLVVGFGSLDLEHN